MALPTLVKTWEFRTNVGLSTSSNSVTSLRQTAVFIKNLLTDTVAHDFNSGDIRLVSGDTYRVDPGDTSYDPATIGNVVGNKIRLYGMTTSDNDGEFTVTAQTDIGAGVYALSYVNAEAGATAEAIVGSVNVLGGNFSNPWTIDHTSDSSTVGASMDHVDRIVTYADWVHSSGSMSYVVLYNPATKTSWLFTGDTDASSYPRSLTAVKTAPNTFTPGTTTVSPSGGVQYTSTSGYWLVGNTSAAVIKAHLMISSDGEQTRLVICKDGVAPLFWGDGLVLNPHSYWASGPDTPAFTFITGAGAISDRPIVTLFNDNAWATLSRIPAHTYVAVADHLRVYFSCEGYGSATVVQNLPNINDLTLDLPLLPIAITSDNQGNRGILGEVPDLWYTATGAGADSGMTLPDDNTRQFIVFGDMVFPWDGSVPELA